MSKPDTRHLCVGKQAHHCKAQKNTKKRINVDLAAIKEKKMSLP